MISQSDNILQIHAVSVGLSVENSVYVLLSAALSQND
jgi:hypothetical protein